MRKTAPATFIIPARTGPGMGRHCGCEHEFSYLLKKHDGGTLTGRVLQIPAVIASGRTKEAVEAEIRKATLAYLDQFEDEHEASLKGRMESRLTTPENGVVLETVPYKVAC